jgi:type II secretory pathway pseudopilin PulG
MVELLLVLTMLGVVTIVAMPAISRSLTSIRADRAAAITVSDMKLAFSMAARQNKPVQLNMLSAQRQYTVTDRATGTVLMRRNFGTGAADLTVSSLTATDAAVEIFPNGLAQNGVDYTIRVGTQQRLVRMTRTGHVTVN